MKKNTFSILYLLLFSTLAFAADDKPFMIRSFNGTSVSKIDVKTSGGSITYEGGNEANPRVEVFATSSGWKGGKLSPDEIKEKLKDYTVDIVQKGGTLTCKAEKKTKEANLNISFKVYCPKKTDIDAQTSGGSVNLKTLEGDLKFTTSGGSLNLETLSGNIAGTTSGGSINLKNCSKKINLNTSGGSINADNCDGDLDLQTSGGSINLEKLKGKIIVETSGGSINADNVDGTLKANTSGGSISLNDFSGSVDASTSGGNVDANIVRLGAYVKLSTSSGNININLPGNEKVNVDLSGSKVLCDNMKNFVGKKDKSVVMGKVNGGGALVKAKTSAGNVLINF